MTTLPIPISLLDRSRTRAGEPAARALRDTVERARRAEELGFGRIWVAEHHAVPGIASGSPPLLMAAIAARTARIRVGSGGVMLPNHRPIVVAEQAKMLAALHSDRIDLGVGRSLGFTAPVRDALGVHDYGPEHFARDLEELTALLAGTAAVTAMPKGVPAPPLLVLATGSGLAGRRRGSGCPWSSVAPSCEATSSPSTTTERASARTAPTTSRACSSASTSSSPTAASRPASWRCRRPGRWWSHARPAPSLPFVPSRRCASPPASRSRSSSTSTRWSTAPRPTSPTSSPRSSSAPAPTKSSPSHPPTTAPPWPTATPPSPPCAEVAGRGPETRASPGPFVPGLSSGSAPACTARRRRRRGTRPGPWSARSARHRGRRGGGGRPFRRGAWAAS
ncbi:hypothetical protein B277_13299 [Janibacter hoylei PVAS-1]|uniref:Luciferase-like domain-containing protein n=1 Tax=Janibacter hoylei PVAS-1 TaxID=1210046 RepID=K1DVD2_9MICO|nr:hypothetical protein B277_13299 [Janibacter hoylei PVAS-1]